MARIFISHSSSNNAEAIALRDWLEQQGWKDEIFLDLDPERGIVAGERWEQKLREAADRCEVVLFLVSKAWLESTWCHKELILASKLNKRPFGVLIEDIPIGDLPSDLTSAWQQVNLASGTDHTQYTITLPITHEQAHASFSQEGLQRLKAGLDLAGLNAKHFPWPPENDPNRPPYRGLKTIEAKDAGIFFGRDGPIVNAIDKLRGTRDAVPPRLMVILGASGAGKSSFMRAGLLPRLEREDRNFLPLPVIRPERAVISGETGLISCIEQAFQQQGTPRAKAEIRTAIEGGTQQISALLNELVNEASKCALIDTGSGQKPSTLILPIDQGEELFRTEGAQEASQFLTHLATLLSADNPAIIALFTIRSDSYDPLQTAKQLEGITQQTISLLPMPKGAYVEVIEGPAKRFNEAGKKLEIEETLIDKLLQDLDEGGAKDALPLLAFTMERLYREYGGDGDLLLSEYEQLGGVKGSITAAVEEAFHKADNNPAIPKDKDARLALLRRGLIPWVAGIDPDTGSPRRRVAKLSNIPQESRPLMELLVEQRLLSTDVSAETGETIIEPAHEALLRQWSLLDGWLDEDFENLSVLEGVKRGAVDWAANGKDKEWLTHAGARLAAATDILTARPDLAGTLETDDTTYLTACREKAEAAKSQELARLKREKRRNRIITFGSLAATFVMAALGWQAYQGQQVAKKTNKIRK